MMKFTGILLLSLLLACSLPGCSNSKKEDDNRETAKQGNLTISADEAFKSVIDSQISVFRSEYPKINVTIEYKPEAACFEDFRKDSARLILVTREPSYEEDKYYRAKWSYGISYSKVANDAIAVIMHPSAKDSLFSMDDIRGILSGKSQYPYRPVFDGLQKTSNLRFMLDSVLRTDSLPGTVSGLENSQAVIDFVAKNPTAMGFVGVSQVGDPDEPDQESFLKKVKVASIKCEKCNLPLYKKPYQANIVTKLYPMVRGLYYIVKNDYGGVATNFGKWLELERGQLIFKRAYLGPLMSEVFVQDTQVEQ